MIISRSKTVETRLVNLVVVDSLVCSNDGCIWMTTCLYLLPIVQYLWFNKDRLQFTNTLIERDIDVYSIA